MRLALRSSCVAACAASAFAQTSLVTLSSSGAQTDQGSLYPELSHDGRFVAFQSSATNLVPNDTNGSPDVFLHDRVLGETIRVSVGTGGGEGDQGALEPAISADARFIAFFSYSTNLAPGDTNAAPDVFVRDVELGLTELVSRSSAGVLGDDASRYASISGDGRYVAFESKATNLVAGDTNGFRDIFVHDRLLGTTVRASVDATGLEANGQSLDVAIAPTGRWLAFESSATNLVTGDTNGFTDIFLKDLLTGAISRVSVDSAGFEANGESLDPSIANNGRYVAFSSYASNLGVQDTNGFADIFLHDVIAGSTVRMNISGSGKEGDADSFDPQINPDGTHTVYYTDASNLDHYLANVYIVETVTGINERVSIGSAGQVTTQGSYWPALSADARWVAFDSFDANLVFADANGVRDVFVHDRSSPFTPFCFGDAASSVVCPCANHGVAKHGCENSATTGGATLEAFGDPANDSVRLVATRELPSALSFVMQAPAVHANPKPFGDGLLCIGGTLKRLYVKNATGGALSVPGASDPSIQTRSAALGDPLTPGVTRYYQIYYRDPAATHCTAGTFNLTNAVAITW
ncbi:MAG: hypothetical protein L6Q99_08580 [Planctomycetes bacterium]|nr:hypothetical protein [Planctomycetota bacterium]